MARWYRITHILQVGREEESLCRGEEACGLDCRAKDLMDPVMADKCLPTLFVGDKEEFNRPFRKGEGAGLASSDCL